MRFLELGLSDFLGSIWNKIERQDGFFKDAGKNELQRSQTITDIKLCIKVLIFLEKKAANTSGARKLWTSEFRWKQFFGHGCFRAEFKLPTMLNLVWMLRSIFNYRFLFPNLGYRLWTFYYNAISSLYLAWHNVKALFIIFFVVLACH